RFLAHEVERALYAAAAECSVQQPAFRAKVHHQQACANGEHALTGEHEHRATESDEQSAQEVAQAQPAPAEEPGPVAAHRPGLGLKKVVRGEPRNHHWHQQDAENEKAEREPAGPEEPEMVVMEKLAHTPPSSRMTPPG